MTDILKPVAPEERIHVLDVLRGWALFGVLWSNLNDHYDARDPVTKLDGVLRWTQIWLLESRFYSLLILLFGIGFGIQLTRAARDGADLRTTYYRRTAALLAIGVIHGTLIWRGDILTIYALVAFALVMFRSMSTRNVAIAAGVIWFLGPTVVREGMFLSGFRIMLPGDGGETTEIYARGTWLEIERARIGGYLLWLGRWGLTSYVSILGAFLTGLWAVKSGYLRRVIDDPRTTRRLLMIALVAAGVGYARWHWADAIWPRAQGPAIAEPVFPYPYFHLAQLRNLVLKLFDWGTEGMAVAYACILVLIWQRPAGARALRPLAAAGRMALTTYLTQSIVCTLLFYSYGLGLYGSVGFTGMLVITLVLFGTQMMVSTWWLSRFRYGPAEWLWRTLTYGRPPRIIAASSPGGAMASAE